MNIDELSVDTKGLAEKVPTTAVGVIIFRDGKVLLGKRKNAHGQGEYAFPGGKLDHLESFADCAKRETREECGIEIDNVRFQFLMNLRDYAPKHYTHVGVIADWKEGEPKVMESEKCESWDWYDLHDLPSPVFTACAKAFEVLGTGEKYID